jgi:hypothetical protein
MRVRPLAAEVSRREGNRYHLQAETMMQATSTKCPICNQRKPSRLCPARGDSICSVCCGTHREQTIRCPLECSYLREARKRDVLQPLDEAAMPNRDIALSMEYLESQGMLGAFLAESLWLAAREDADCVDTDMREALAALIQTYRTLESGLYYESRPENSYAAGVTRRVRQRIQELERKLDEYPDVPKPRDRDIMRMLVFFQRTELQVANGRRYGRSFLDWLRRNYEEVPALQDPAGDQDGSPLIL